MTPSLEEIGLPTKGFEEAVVEIPLTESDDAVSVETSTPNDVSVLAYSLATEGSVPMMIDQQLMSPAKPGDMELSRWMRVTSMMEGNPTEPFR